MSGSNYQVATIFHMHVEMYTASEVCNDVCVCALWGVCIQKLSKKITLKKFQESPCSLFFSFQSKWLKLYPCQPRVDWKLQSFSKTGEKQREGEEREVEDRGERRRKRERECSKEKEKQRHNEGEDRERERERESSGRVMRWETMQKKINKNREENIYKDENLNWKGEDFQCLCTFTLILKWNKTKAFF